jgi:hypothetical protein
MPKVKSMRMEGMRSRQASHCAAMPRATIPARPSRGCVMDSALAIGRPCQRNFLWQSLQLVLRWLAASLILIASFALTAAIMSADAFFMSST